jgi:hypothetical protein
MAVGDIYRVQLNFDGPSGNHTTRMYYREEVGSSSVAPEQQLATAWHNQLKDLARAVITDDYAIAALVIEKAFGNPRPKWIRQVTGGQLGTGGTLALPSNNAQIIQISQSTFSARSNGRCFFPPPPEASTASGVIDGAFLTGNWIPFLTALVAPLLPDTGTGEWKLGVISSKVLNAAPPAKDWAGAFAPAVSLGIEPVVGIQRRRQSKREGWYSAT